MLRMGLLGDSATLQLPTGLVETAVTWFQLHLHSSMSVHGENGRIEKTSRETRPQGKTSEVAFSRSSPNASRGGNPRISRTEQEKID